MCAINEPHRQDPQNPGAVIQDRWKRKALLHEGKLLVVEDWTGAITGTGPTFEGVVARHPVLGHTSPFTGDLPNEIHAIAHTEGGRKNITTEQFFTAQASKKVIVLHVGSTGPVPAYQANSKFTSHHGARFVWLRATDLNAYRTDGWLGQFLKLTFEDAEELAKCTSRAEISGEIDRRCPEFLDIIFPGRIENRLAYRLLREARAACGDKGEVPDFSGTGLTIHAPKSLEDWWKPFDCENGRDDAKAIRVLARCIVDEGDPSIESGWSEVKKHATSGDDAALKAALAIFLKVPDTEITKR